MTNNYHTQESERVLIILNCLDWEGIRFVITLNDIVQEKCRTGMGLFEVLSNKSTLQH